MTQRTCREHGGFEPDIRHRTNDATVSLALVAHGLAVALFPDLALPADHPGVAAHRRRRSPAGSSPSPAPPTPRAPSNPGALPARALPPTPLGLRLDEIREHRHR